MHLRWERVFLSDQDRRFVETVASPRCDQQAIDLRPRRILYLLRRNSKIFEVVMAWKC